MGNEVSQIYNNILPPRWWNGIDYTPIGQLGPLAINLFGVQDPTTGGVVGVEPFEHQSLDLPNEWNFDMTTQNPPTVGTSPSPVTKDIGGTLGDYVAPQVSISGQGANIVAGASPRWALAYKDPTQPAAQQQQAPAASGGNAFPGIVRSGSGTTYTVDIYKTGLGAGATSVSAKIIQISSTDSVPAGTGVIVVQTTRSLGGTQGSVTEYWAQPAVWLS
jgi:hypothetical protein